ncbi:MAG TPA: response regulator transcription factor [Vicinamibacteria bacterium]|nr:response regulator transcription factor [Vicinamibacteria bacterium]
MKRILVIEDDPDIVELLRYNLEKEGFEVSSAGEGKSGLELLRQGNADLLILDLMLPQLSGLEVCKEIRKDDRLETLPVIVLTARGEETDRILGLELGADDYVTKPFSVREMVARVKALLRRAEREKDKDETKDVLSIGPLTIDPSSYRVQRGGEAIQLTALEFRLLHYLASRPNRVLTRDHLLDAVWGSERFVTPRSVDVYIRRLREKIEMDPVKPQFLKTLRGAGYSFETGAS